MSDLRVFLYSNGIPIRPDHAFMTWLTAARGAATAGSIGFGTASVYTTSAVVGGAAFAAGLGTVAGTVVGSWVALGAGYNAARKDWRNENLLNGFVHGFVTSLLGWSGHQVADHFGRRFVVHHNAFDGQMDFIEVKAFNEGLTKGYQLANGLSDADRKDFLRQVRRGTSVPAPAREDWSNNARVQDQYIDDLAIAMRLRIVGSGPVKL